MQNQVDTSAEDKPTESWHHSPRLSSFWQWHLQWDIYHISYHTCVPNEYRESTSTAFLCRSWVKVGYTFLHRNRCWLGMAPVSSHSSASSRCWQAIRPACHRSGWLHSGPTTAPTLSPLLSALSTNDGKPEFPSWLDQHIPEGLVQSERDDERDFFRNQTASGNDNWEIAYLRAQARSLSRTPVQQTSEFTLSMNHISFFGLPTWAQPAGI